MEEAIMELIMNAGCARSKAMELIMKVKEGNLEETKKSMEEADEFLSNAHNVQTKLIQEEAAGKKTEINLLMVHAQDHLMNAMTIKDLAKEIIEMYEKFS
ncbi:PTS system cellobiose-specific IIA component [Clostridium saccharoperbutylacetonicum]|uniref:Lichenan-specific phosphotransferase enzyme IIA component LicA n=1 Tax=Clostridium saccharoperbutylacetonicum N1-4(HMT) TaxID=931276 RepID=M1MWN6_9CLOT|nr:PTS lactose/cellobiose transporter subunit IIA [Clostridium saccharoperbutylacetonicum]AGF55882.1 lichenan-specific phosphotransferase enzyme IIA component LicA [Clostridium saccharoperbutylacetonicum N1-4(HMT)]NRT63379.1 PTS system cellobiose-specific IIA component [Clostridium saccharoperbutylacetonicum]NSB26741.1 PTS system cellobiose-specific IIA component [Clostridium saccharoperbutylacetonicum]NSB46093.1 PTS system cellobiose-specific IIA component [Clostridium saccharoperbutylacetonic